MRQLNLTLISPDGLVFEDTLLPEDMETEEIISELKEQLDLSDATENGVPIRYFLMLPARNITMLPGQTLHDVGLENGDKLRMMASEPVTTPIIAQLTAGAIGALGDELRVTASGPGTEKAQLVKHPRPQADTINKYGQLIDVKPHVVEADFGAEAWQPGPRPLDKWGYGILVGMLCLSYAYSADSQSGGLAFVLGFGLTFLSLLALEVVVNRSLAKRGNDG